MSFLAIGFDVDGTLLDSITPKARAFAVTLAKTYGLPNERLEQIEGIYRNSLGTPRRSQVELVRTALDLNILSVAELDRWSDAFTAAYSDQQAPLFADAESTLRTLSNRYKLFISSSVPDEDLQRTLANYPQITKYFTHILGSKNNDTFVKGGPHLHYIAGEYKIGVNRFAFVGDAPADVLGAKSVGAFAVGKANSDAEEIRLRQANPDLLIRNLSDLLKHF